MDMSAYYTSQDICFSIIKDLPEAENFICINSMEKNLKCPICQANAYHIDRLENGKYAIRCLRANSKEHQRVVKPEQDTLNDLEFRT